MDVEGSFEQYEKKQRVPREEYDAAQKLWPTIESRIAQALGAEFNEFILSGSYARKVQVGHIKDLDMIFVLNDPVGVYAASATAALERLKEAATACSELVFDALGVRAAKFSVVGQPFTVDLVAALVDPAGEVLLARRCPERGEDDWTPSRPRACKAAAVTKNLSTGGKYKRATRILKTWNRRFEWDGELGLLPSYLIESILFWAVDQALPYSKMMLAFFEAAAADLANPQSSVRCPGNPDEYVDGRLDVKRAAHALGYVHRALGDARRAVAVEATDPDAARELWAGAALFGVQYPAPSTDQSELPGAMRAQTATVVAGSLRPAPSGSVPVRARAYRSR